jgi:outer membrane protein
MLKKIIFLSLILIITARGEDRLLDSYIKIALQNNLALQQQNFSLQKSMAALQEARGLFLPSISLNARYTRAGGGRTIEIPVGDYMNPLNRAINQIIGQPVLPENVPNEIIPFLREKEQETKVSLFQPIFKPEIYYNYKINQDLSKIETMQRDLYKRQLIADVKTAFYTYLKTLNVLEIIERTEELLEENMRVNQKLFQNQKATKDVVYRAKSDLSLLEQEKAAAIKNINLAKAYFNFLLNRPMEEDINKVSVEDLPLYPNIELIEATDLAIKNREEIDQLDFAIDASANNVKIAKSAFLPDLIFAGDYGFQGEEYRFSKEDDFWMASVVLNWNLFRGFQDKARIQRGGLEKKRLETKKLEVSRQIQLEVREAYYNLMVSLKSIQSAQDRLNSAMKSFEIVNKKYEVGMIPQVQYLDTRNNWIQAEVNHTVTIFDYHIRQAEFERVVALYDLDKE